MSSRSRFPASRGVSRPSSAATSVEDAGSQRSLTLVAVRGGVVAALLPLGVLMLLAVIGWFLTDGGVHGAPRDALRVGALGWLMAHGSGVHVRGAEVTVIPLGLSLLVGYAVWRSGHRTGERLSSHGPDAFALSDGERDLTVPAGAAIFTGAYVVTAIAVAVLAGSLETQPSLGAVLAWSLLVAGGVGGAGIATGSGRAAVWLGRVPAAVVATLASALRLVAWFLALSTLVFLVALAIDGAAAFTVLSRLGTNLPGGIAYVLLSLAVVPNAAVFGGSYLLGPGFVVGTGTLVSPTVVALGPVPMFPLLAALPDNGPTPFWTPFLIALPPVLAAIVVARSRSSWPTMEWDIGAVRGLSTGVLAGVLFAILAAVAGGSAGPGRMAEVGPLVASTLFHAIVAFGIGGLVGGLVGTWLTRRNPPEIVVVRTPDPDTEPTVVVGEKPTGGTGATDQEQAEPTVPLYRRLIRRERSDETEAEDGPARG